MLPIRTILHATDFSENSKAAFQLACALARDYQALLVVAHVAEPPLLLYGNGIVLVPHAEDLVEATRERLQKIAAPDLRLEHRLVEGDPRMEIVRLAQEIGANLIVLGTHGRGGFGRLLMGSVAESVSRKAPCPVLTIRGSLPHKAEEPGPAMAGAAT
jgi:nucleotide-binding universal stress UspA family protein